MGAQGPLLHFGLWGLVIPTDFRLCHSSISMASHQEESKNAQQDATNMKRLLFGGAAVFMMYMMTTMGIMVFSSRYTSEVHVHRGAMVGNDGHALKTVEATFHPDTATVAHQSDEELASLQSLVLPFGDENFIGKVTAVTRSKTSMVVYFQENPIVSWLSVSLADNSMRIQKVGGQERRLDAPPFFNEPTWNERMPSASG